jgi:hypothetical protein
MSIDFVKILVHARDLTMDLMICPLFLRFASGKSIV